MKVAIVYHSRNGHTRLQAEAVARGAGGCEGATLLLLSADEAMDRLDELDGCDAIIFGSPTYMGNISAGMKAFLEAAVGRWRTQAWRDKIAGAFTNSGHFSGDKVNTLTGLMINAMQHGMIFVGLGMLPGREGFDTLQGPGPAALNRNDASIGPMSSSFGVAAGDAPGPGDIATAEAYGRRVAQITAQFLRGRA